MRFCNDSLAQSIVSYCKRTLFKIYISGRNIYWFGLTISYNIVWSQSCIALAMISYDMSNNVVGLQLQRFSISSLMTQGNYPFRHSIWKFPFLDPRLYKSITPFIIPSQNFPIWIEDCIIAIKSLPERSQKQKQNSLVIPLIWV